MKVLLLVVVLCVSVLAAKTQGKLQYSLDDARTHFENFIAEHRKNYSPQEMKKRFEIFKQNLKDINYRNSDPREHAEFGITRFSDLTAEEFVASYTGLLPGAPADGVCQQSADTDIVSLTAPEQLDWRDSNVVTPVKQQGLCGSCWAFSTTGNVESQYAIKTGKLVSLSEQQLVDCDEDDNGCGGGLPFRAMSYLASVSGLETEDNYPYIQNTSTCAFDSNNVAVRVTGCKTYDMKDEDKVKELVATVGPISFGLDFEGVRNYHGGVYRNCSAVRPNHAVLLVGYGEEDGVPYWLVKNSHGTEFGENGYFKMERGVDCLLMLTQLMASAIVL